MADICDRLRAGGVDVGPWGQYEHCQPTSLEVEAATEIDRLRQVIAACETQFRMLARLATAGKHVPKWEAVSLEALAGAEMCKGACDG